MTAEIGLGLAVVCAGLWSGLLLTLTTILHPIYAAEDGRGFALALRDFLPVARRSPTNYVLVIGPLLTSRLLSEPTYDVILGWDPDAVPADWLAVRRRYFALNWVRAVFTWVAFALFLAASYVHLR